LRATSTKLSQNPLLPTSANRLVPPSPARIAIAAVITAAACTAISIAVVLFPLHDRVVCTCRLQFSPFLPFLPLRCYCSLLFLYVVRSVSPLLVSCSPKPVRAQLPRAAQPRPNSFEPGPAVPVALPPTLPPRDLLLARPSLVSGPPALPPTTTRRWFPLCRCR
jgi:hypothetical protein